MATLHRSTSPSNATCTRIKALCAPPISQHVSIQNAITLGLSEQGFEILHPSAPSTTADVSVTLTGGWHPGTAKDGHPWVGAEQCAQSSALGARQRCKKAAGRGSGVAHSPSANLRGGRARRLLPPALTPLPHLPRERDGGPMRAVPAALPRRNIRGKDRKRKQPRGCPRATQFGTLFGKINHSATFQENGGGWRERERKGSLEMQKLPSAFSPQSEARPGNTETQHVVDDFSIKYEHLNPLFVFRPLLAASAGPTSFPLPSLLFNNNNNKKKKSYMTLIKCTY